MADQLPAACEARKDDLVALAFGELTGERAEETRAHASSCPACGAYLAAMTGTLETVRTLPKPEPPAALTERILAAARASEEAAARPVAPEAREGLLERLAALLAPLVRRPAFAAAAAAVAVVVAAVVVATRVGAPADVRTTTSAGPPAAVARGDDRAAGEKAPGAQAAPAPPAAVPAEPPASAAREAAPSAPKERAQVAGQAPAPTAATEAAIEGDTPSAAPAQPSRTREAGARPARRVEPRAGTGARAPREDRGEEPAAGASATAAMAEANRDEEADEEASRFYEATPHGVLGGTERGEPSPEAEGEAGGGAGRRGAESGRERTSAQTGDDRGRAAAGPVATEATDLAATPPAYGAGGYPSPTSVATAPSPPAVPSSTAAPPPPPPASPAGPPAQPVMRMAAEDSYAAGGPGGASGAAAPSATGAESYAGMEEQAERRQDDVDVAQRYLDAGDATSAESVLEETLRTRPSPGATFLLAEAYARQGRWSEAARMYDLFLARYLDDPRADEARWRAAAAYRRSGALARAEALLEQLVGVPGYDSRARTAIDEMTATEAAPSDVPAAAAPAEQQP